MDCMTSPRQLAAPAGCVPKGALSHSAGRPPSRRDGMMLDASKIPSGSPDGGACEEVLGMHHHCLDPAGARDNLSECTLRRTHLFLSAPTYLLERPMRWRWAVRSNAGRRSRSESGRCLRTGCQCRFSRTGWRVWGPEGSGTGVRPGPEYAMPKPSEMTPLRTRTIPFLEAKPNWAEAELHSGPIILSRRGNCESAPRRRHQPVATCANCT